MGIHPRVRILWRDRGDLGWAPWSESAGSPQLGYRIIQTLREQHPEREYTLEPIAKQEVSP